MGTERIPEILKEELLQGWMVTLQQASSVQPQAAWSGVRQPATADRDGLALRVSQDCQP